MQKGEKMIFGTHRWKRSLVDKMNLLLFALSNIIETGSKLLHMWKKLVKLKY